MQQSTSPGIGEGGESLLLPDNLITDHSTKHTSPKRSSSTTPYRYLYYTSNCKLAQPTKSAPDFIQSINFKAESLGTTSLKDGFDANENHTTYHVQDKHSGGGRDHHSLTSNSLSFPRNSTASVV